jgi:DEAD/DEAH box helicase domain-containing protein
MIISDFHPNGSGMTRWIMDHWAKCIRTISMPSGSDNFADMLLSPRHGEGCKDACYSCLKSFRNMSYHALLDWRLGVSILKVLGDANYKCGLDGQFNSPELEGWLSYAKLQRDSFCTAFSDSNPIPNQWGILPGLDIEDFRIIIIHELWDPSSIEDGSALHNAISLSQETQGNKLVRYVTPFNLARRPSWVITDLQQGT